MFLCGQGKQPGGEGELVGRVLGQFTEVIVTLTVSPLAVTVDSVVSDVLKSR